MYNARFLSSTFLAALVGFSFCACDPRIFDDLADEAWVHSDKKPGGLDSIGYGIGLVAGGGDAFHYIAAAAAPPAVVMVKFDRSGGRSAESEEIRKTLPSAEALTAPLAMASDPSGFSSPRGNVAVATFDGSLASLFMVRGENGRSTEPSFNLKGGTISTGVAFGATDASAAVDLVAISGSEINVMANYQSLSDPNGGKSCSFGGTGGGVLVADLNLAAGDEVVFAVDGTIQIAAALSLIAAADASEGCFDSVSALGTIAAPGGEASFGAAMLTADFDGNGELDLVVSAPAEKTVYVFMNYSTETPSPGQAVSAPGGAVEFGISIAAGDFDGDGRDELVVGDPGQSVSDHDQAGIAYLYTTNASGALQAPLELHDASPETDQRFGQSLTVSRAFGGENLVVGAKNEVFSYFRTPLSDDDDFRN